jgi:hypothetical protein
MPCSQYAGYGRSLGPWRPGRLGYYRMGDQCLLALPPGVCNEAGARVHGLLLDNSGIDWSSDQAMRLAISSANARQ